MRKLRLFALLAATVLAAAEIHAGQSVGLVLSGGGSKGIAHIGFIKALEENNIPVDCITGTSMGAIVGALYASGYSPDEMLAMLSTEQFMNWATGVTAASDKFYFYEPQETPGWLTVNLASGDSATLAALFPTRLVNPLPMSFAFMEIFSPPQAAADNDFDKLFVPFRCVASDIYRHRKVVFSRGELPLAVRASMSFPLVYQPIMIGDTLMYDGGLYDVYPVDVMLDDFNPDRIIGVDVSTPNTPPGLNDLVGQIENMVMSGYLPKIPDGRGINVVFDLERFGLTHWGAAKEIYEIGYRRGLELADSIKSITTARRTPEEVARRRAEFRKRIRPMEIRDVAVTGTDSNTGRWIMQTFRGSVDSTMTVGEARSGFYKLTSTGRMRNLVPHAAYDTATGTFDIDLHADVTKNFRAEVGGFLTSGSQSMLYAAGHYNPLDYRHPYASLEGWAGINYLAASGDVGMLLPTSAPSRLGLKLTAARQRLYEHEKMFYDLKSPAFAINSEITAGLYYALPAGRHGIFEAQLGYGHLTSGYRPPLQYSATIGRISIIDDLARLRLQWTRSTLDDAFLPTTGSRYEVSLTGYAGDRRQKPTGLPKAARPTRGEAFASAESYIRVAKGLSVGLKGEALYSSQKLSGDYTASMILAPQFSPSFTTDGEYMPAFRANEYVAASVTPVWQAAKIFQIRLNATVFAPMRRILVAPDGQGARYGAIFGSCNFYGQLSAALRLPIGAVVAYCSYSSGHARHWSGGISLGIPIKAPKFRR